MRLPSGEEDASLWASTQPCLQGDFMATRGQPNHLSAAAAAQRIAAGKLTSVALVEACLARIAERENDVHAWAFVDAELALAQARARDAEPPRGPLHGIPVGIKDV